MFGLDLISLAVGGVIVLVLGVIAPKLVAKWTAKTATVVSSVKTAAANSAAAVVADVVKKV